MIGLIGKKIGMTQIFNEKGEIIPVTILQAGPCTVIQKKVKEKNGYNAIQLGFEDTKENRTNKPLLGHFKKSGLKPKRILREVKVDDIDKFKESDEIKVDIFSNSKYVNIQGISKGKGFTGVVKRWGFAGMPATHGTHKKHRHPGSIGQSAFPGRVFKGLKMAGRAGNKKVTVKKLAIAGIDSEKDILLVEGSVPGSRGTTLLIYSDMPSPAKETVSKRSTTEESVVERKTTEKQVEEKQVKETQTAETPVEEKEEDKKHTEEKKAEKGQVEEKQPEENTPSDESEKHSDLPAEEKKEAEEPSAPKEAEKKTEMGDDDAGN